MPCGQIQRRAFEIALYLPIGQLVGHRAFRNSLNGIPDSPIPVLWNIDKNSGWVRRNGYAVIPELCGVHPDFAFTGELLRPMCPPADTRNS